MASNNLNILMQKLYDMEKQLGGSNKSRGKSDDEFKNFEAEVKELIGII